MNVVCRRMIWSFLILPLIFSISVFAQTRPVSGKNGGRITGVLVHKQTKKPASRVWLHLFRYEGKDKNGNDVISLFILNGQFPRAQSDSTGRFTFNSVPTGRYIIKTGTEVSVDTEDHGASNLKDASGAKIIIKLESGQIFDLGTIQVQD